MPPGKQPWRQGPRRAFGQAGDLLHVVKPSQQDRTQPPSGFMLVSLDHGDEHVIKFADTAADAYVRTGNPDALAAAFRAADLIER